ncbi:hypothetical protein WA1_18330 [Scytonema hofmannii PCC 7110]|uniref:Uncharacterized protein n=1 Tax=Scytonema hofmannii PCC 7110 TaxID=128403 RepID=A0A139XBB2_9CYAN|nr:hypothetical protein [Scytonema hofmannii]KYC41975.1 hypothetical protein WA1_18330 [Scytonema hofmannii PCC 7110]
MLADSKTSVVMPVYYQVALRQGTQWAFIHGETFYNPFNLPRFSIPGYICRFWNLYDKSSKRVFQNQWRQRRILFS